MAPFMLSSVNVALPAIQHEFGVNAVLLGWIATSYLLATGILLVPIGKFADMYGRRKVFVTGIIVFTCGSLVAIFVPNVGLFIASRVIQGLGAAMFLTTGMAILTLVFPPARRGWALGVLVTAVYVGLATGPFAGGLLTRYCGWRSIFVVIFLLGGGSFYVTHRYLKGEWAETSGGTFDLGGSLVYALAIFFLVYGGTRMPELSGGMLVLAGGFGMVVFFRMQKKSRYPVFEVGLFQNNRPFLFSSLAALIHYAATFGITFQISLFLQYIKGMSPQAAGTVLMIQPVMMALFSSQAGKLSDRIEPRVIASAGMGLTAIGLACFVFLDPATPLWLIGANLGLLGFGFALFSSPNMSAIMGSVERKQYGLASGTVATMRLLGQMCSMTLVTVFLTHFIGREEIRPGNYALFLESMRMCFAFFVVLCSIGIGFSLFRGNVRV
ncbi:MAG: MFS transporter [Proteobacteria bacterium]|nr:MFS transporter [Pseudomonadota bacterium]MBU1736695.1 MFS transporter [Pseudomonadota bacterium]